MMVKTMKTLMLIVVMFFMCMPLQAQTSTINWTTVHQIIDGFGAADAEQDSSMTSAQQSFFFGLGTGQLGLSILRSGVTNGSETSGSCLTVSVSCAGPFVSDMQAIIAQGGRVIAAPWSPPAAYKTNSDSYCTTGGGNGALISGDYGAYARWLANFVQSLKTEDGISLYALSVQNEPDQCQDYDSALWTAAQLDSFIKTNLGPTFASDGLSTLIFMPENSGHGSLTGADGGGTCLTDSSCSNYVGGVDWHDYDVKANSSDTISSATNPWASLAKKYWETEVSCLPGADPGPSGCESGWNTDMTTDGLMWAGIIDDRLVNENADAYLYWWLIGEGNTDDQGLESSTGSIAQRAYVFGQYSKFIRPGYYRIDATHIPQSGVSVSAYQNTGTKTLVIVATNYTGSAVSQGFSITNAPTFSSFTPYITSTSLSLAAQTGVPVSANSFTYKLPAGSVTTFVGTGTVVVQPPTNVRAHPF